MKTRRQRIHLSGVLLILPFLTGCAAGPLPQVMLLKRERRLLDC